MHNMPLRLTVTMYSRYVYLTYEGVGQARALALTGRISGEGPLREANGRAGA